MRICIPTYHREDVKTVTTLLSHGFNGDDIIIGTQDRHDFELLSGKYAGCGIKVILDESKHNAAGNRNQLIDYCNDVFYAMFMDDDIDDMTFTPDDLHMMAAFMYREDIKLLEIDCHALDIEHRLPNVWYGWGYGGCCFILSNTDGIAYMDESFDMCEDNEFAMRLRETGEKIAYTTAYRVKTTPMGESDGGCEETYAQGNPVIENLSRLSERYPHLVQIDGLVTSKPLFIWGPDAYGELRLR